MDSFHQPVLLRESLELLQVKPSGKYIDATLGGGGHTAEILKSGGRVLGIDLDQEALDYVLKNQEAAIKDDQLILAKGNFRNLDEIAHLNGFENADGVLFDLGVSSHQIDTAGRGFSYLMQGPLDMRMDQGTGLTAEVLVNLLGKQELTDIFSKYGQERRAHTVSKGIISQRRIKAIKTTEELSQVIANVYGIKGEASDFTKTEINKRVFQALRIAVNNELENISEGLPKSLRILRKKGRMAVITFHSLEDAIVKKIFGQFEQEGLGRAVTTKPVTAGKEEISMNSRSKSAKLRVFEKN